MDSVRQPSDRAGPRIYPIKQPTKVIVSITFVAGAVLSLIVLIGTLLPTIRTSLWWVRSLGFPRVQFAVLAAVAIILLAVPDSSVGNERWLFILSALACGFLQLIRIYPYTPLARKQSLRCTTPDPDRQLRVMVANVLMPNRNDTKLLQMLHREKPDLFLAVETDKWWTDRIVESCGEEYPWKVVRPQDNTYGMILCSRLELVDTEVRFLVEDDIPSIRSGVRLPGGRVITIHCLHPRPPLPSSDTDHRDAELLMVAKEIEEADDPAVIFGDLNDVAWSFTTRLFQKISETVDPRIGRGTYSTFHAGVPLLRYPLDHIFYTPDFNLVQLKRLDSFGSDHFPMFADIHLEPNGQNAEEIPHANGHDRSEAEDLIAAGTDDR